MKRRNTISLLIVLSLLILLTTNLPLSFAQDPPQSNLPDGARARLVTGYTYGVGAIAYNPTGSILVTAASSANDGGLLLWDTATDTIQKVLDDGTRYYTAIAFSPDGTLLATASGKSVQVRDAATGRPRTWNVPGAPGDGIIDTLSHNEHVHGIAFSPDGSALLTDAGTRSGGDLALWNVATGTPIARGGSGTGFPFDAWGVAYHPTNDTLIANGGGYAGKVLLWSVATGSSIEFIKSFGEFTRDVRNVAFSPDGNMLASSGWEETHRSFLVRLWDPVTDELLNTMDHSGDGYAPVNSVAFSPDSTLIASGGGNIVRLWNATTGNLISTFTGHTNNVTSIAFSPDGNTLASGSKDNTVLLWQLAPTSATITFTPDSVADQTFTVGTPVSLTLPSATGGTDPYTYSLDPIPAGLQFDTATQLLSGTPTAATPATLATYTATDATGASGSLTFSIEVIEDGTGPGDDALDVDGDGQVTVIDLAMVALFYGLRVPVGVSLAADVNADGVVDLADLTAVAQAIDAAGGGVNQLSVKEVELALLIAAEQAAELEAAAGSPGRAVASVSVRLSSKNVSDALAAARTDLRKPQKGFAVLETFLALLTELTATPETTALLANYPNPFNPETWIPYHLSKDTEVIVSIYNMRGVSVRELVLGHQSAGVYESRGRAAYWDGRNDSGEPVASGVYFYTLTAGDFTATRKLLIRK